MLGPTLEGFLRDAVVSGHRYAPAALGTLEEASIATLSKSLASEDLLFSAEAAKALHVTGLTNHVLVVRELQISPRAAAQYHRIKSDQGR
jgi:hypothetical protein